MKLFAIALLVLTVMGNRHTTQHFLGQSGDDHDTAGDDGSDRGTSDHDASRDDG